MLNENKKKRIMLLANNDIWLYKLRKEIILKLLDEKYEVVISCPPGDYIQEMVGWGCIYVETKVDRRGTNPLKDFKSLISYIKVLNKVKPSIVLTYTIKPNLYGGLACRLLGIPCINNITGLGSGFSKNSTFKFFLTLLYKISLKKSACVFFQNTEDMKILVENKIVKGPFELIPGSGVNLEEYCIKEFPQSKHTSFIFIGRIMKDKGIDQYLEASKIIKQKFPDTSFKIIGFIEPTQLVYKDLIRKYEEEGWVEFLGYQSDIKPFIEESQCIIQASHGGEGMSNVLLETAATGRALIASNIPGCIETIDNNINGYIFERKSTKSLVDKIERFIKLSLEEKKNMGINSRLKVKKEFDREIVVNSYLIKVKEISG